MNTIDRLISSINKQIAIVLLVVFYLSQAIGKIWEWSGKGDIFIAKLIKIIVMVYMVLALINSRQLKKLIPFVVLGIVFILGQLLIPNGFSENSLTIFARYCFPLLLFYFFTVHQLDKNSSKSFLEAYEYVMLVNSILILTGFIFKIHLFETYNNIRFGYNGLFMTSATASYVYIISLFYILIQFKQKGSINWRMIIVLLAGFCVGTKAIYLSLIIAVLYFLSQLTLLKKQWRYLIISFIAIGVLAGAYGLFFEWGLFNEVRQKHGLMSSLLSLRNNLLQDRLIPYVTENWGLGNYLFGGVSDFSLRSQMGIIDLFFFWGILGGVFYLKIFFNSFLNFKPDKLIKIFLLTLMIMVALAGNFFFYSTIPIFMLAIREAVLLPKDI